MFAKHPLPLWYLAHRPVLGIFAAADPLDSWGRPLVEWATIRHSDRIVRAPCPYTDSRGFAGSSYNSSALDALLSNYSEVLARARSLAALLPLSTAYTAEERLWQFADLACSEVSRHVVRALVTGSRRGPDGALCALQKICRGLRYTCERALEQGVSFGQVHFCCDFYEFADADGLLVGEAEVCAASPSLIRRFLEVIVCTLRESDTCHSRSFGPELTMQAAVHGARILTFAYEAARVLVSKSSAGYVDDCRHTFPASGFAHECALTSGERVLDHMRLLERLSNQVRHPGATWDCAVLAEPLGNACMQQSQPAWARLQMVALDALNKLNLAIAGLHPSIQSVCAIGEEDLELFFGPVCLRESTHAD